MNKLQKAQESLQKTRDTWQNLEDQIYGRIMSKEVLKQRIAQRFQRQGTAGDPTKEKEWQTVLALEDEISKYRQLQGQQKPLLEQVEKSFDQLGAASELVDKYWSTELPVLLFPLRVQFRFVKNIHLAKASQENIFDSSGINHSRRSSAFSLDKVEGVSAEQSLWTQAGPRTLVTVDQLKVKGRNNRNFARNVERAAKGQVDRKWLTKQEDTYELLVRIYPDEIFLQSHEANLTLEEVAEGRAFWNKMWQLERSMGPEDTEAKRNEQVLAWKMLQDKFMPARAAWIYRQTMPQQFPPSSASAAKKAPVFFKHQIAVKPDDWTLPLTSRIMPDHFEVNLYGNNSKPSKTIRGKRIIYPLPLSHDPSKAYETGDSIPDEIKWITDFQEAEKIGMGIRIPLTKQEYSNGFARLVVLGVNLSLDANHRKSHLEELFTNHKYKEGGLSIIPQGTATNNFGKKRSGYSFNGPEAAEVFAAIHEGIDTGRDFLWTDKRDGQYLAELLGLSPSVFSHIFRADVQDIAGAMAMNHLLWPATAGYFLEQFFQPLLKQKQIDDAAFFFKHYVSGRGFLPAVQIGSQPYGVLATTAYSRLSFSQEETFLKQLFQQVLKPLDSYWTRLTAYVRHIGNLHEEGTSQIHKYAAPFVEMLGLQASSETFYSRPVLGEYFLWNLFRAHFPGKETGDVEVGDLYLDKWNMGGIYGLDGKENYIPVSVRENFKKIFAFLSENTDQLAKNRIFQQHLPDQYQLLTGGIIDTLPPSTSRGLQLWEGKSANYLQHLYQLDADGIKSLFQPGGEEQPNALLYLLARQALARTYLDSAIQLETGSRAPISLLDFELEHLWTDNQLRKEQVDFLKRFNSYSDDDLNYTEQGKIIRYQDEFKPVYEILVDNVVNPINEQKTYRSDKWTFFSTTTKNDIDTRLSALLNQRLSPEQLANHDLKDLTLSKKSLDLLSQMSTASLQLLFTEHMDLCHYRLDAWMQGIVNKRLFDMRDKHPEDLYFGAYGYLEHVRRRADNEGIEAKIIQQPKTLTQGSEPDGRLPDVVMPVLNFDSFHKQKTSLEEALAESWIYLGSDKPAALQYDGNDRETVVAMLTDSDYNQGFMHTPSQAHAVTAAILRSGFMANNPEQAHDAFAVNLSSNSVRNALYLIEGVKNGQALPELLGYQFERYLHDNATGPLDKYLLTLRTKFPLKADQLPTYDQSQPLEKQEAFHVVDGWKLVQKYRDIHTSNQGIFEHMKSSWSDYGINGSDREIQDLFQAMEQTSQNLDSVSDLLLSESVYQVAKGNLAGSATALKMFNHEVELDTPEIIDTPRNHQLLSHMMGVQFDVLKRSRPWKGRWTPRSYLNPSLNNWLADQLPRPHTICVRVQLSNGQYKKIKVSEMGWYPFRQFPHELPLFPLQPVDFLTLFDGREAFSENSDLSWFIRMAVKEKYPAEEHPEQVVIHYAEREGLTASQISLYEIYPLISTILEVLEQSRPMLPADLQRETDAIILAENAASAIDNTKLIGQLEMIIEGNHSFSLQRFADHLHNFAYRLRRARASNFPAEDAQLSYNNLQEIMLLCYLINQEGNYFHWGRTYSEENRELLLEQAVGTRESLLELKNSTSQALETAKTIADPEDQWEALEQICKQIFGQSYFVAPYFDIPNVDSFRPAYEYTDLLSKEGPFVVEEWLQGLAQVRKPIKTYTQLRQFRDLLELSSEDQSPRIIQLPFGSNTEQYRWLGIEFPEDTPIPADPLSLALELPDNYRANATQCGFVIDFWREALPEKTAVSGIAMHYDQPNSEPPQSLLLCVAPNSTTGAHWKWEDLLTTITDTMHMAKKRAVDPDLLAKEKPGGLVTDVLKYILPGVLAPVCFNGKTPWVDFGVNNDQKTEN